MKPFLFTTSMKLADIIQTDYKLLLLLPRFGLNFGFGDKTVKECCEKNHISADFFIIICNIYAFEHYLPDSKDIEGIDVEQLILYLQRSHIYYKENRIQVIQEQLLAISEEHELKHKKILNSFFEEYKKEVINHFNYEEDIVFPYIRSLIAGKVSTGYEIDIFEHNHSNIDEKLHDLKNIIIKYLPGSSTLTERTNILFDIFSLEEDLSKHTLIEDKILIPLVHKSEHNYGK